MTPYRLLSVLTCPSCAHQEVLLMPQDRCVVAHRCAGCGRLLRPLPGDCCVFCSYGSERCPPEQARIAADQPEG